MSTTVIVSGARTPFGKLGGTLSRLTAAELGGMTIKAALERASNVHEVDEVIMGSVLQGGQGQIPSRQAARHADLPWSVPTQTINKVCASGMRSVTTADQIIRAGDAKVIVAWYGIHVPCSLSSKKSTMGLQNGRWCSTRCHDFRWINLFVYRCSYG